MSSIETHLEALRRQFAVSQSESANAARSRLSAQLNQFLRRLRQYSSELEFAHAIVDGATLFAGSAAFFTLEGASVCLLAGKGSPQLSPGLRFDLAAVRAFAHAIQAQEVVIALRTPGEVGSELAGTEPAVIVPIHNAERVAAVLFGAGNTDAEGLDLIAALASLVLSRKRAPAGLAELSVALPPPAKANFPPWAALSEERRNLHWRARRFARVRVSEWLLAKPEAARAGLEQNDLYLFLKKEIDTAREAFRIQFMTDRSMVDYLHLELIAAAANGDESKLGADYPGPLV